MYNEVLKFLYILYLLNTYAVENNFKLDAGILKISALYELINEPFASIIAVSYTHLTLPTIYSV